MISWGVEQYRDVIAELKPLFPLHYKELALEQDKVPLDPQWEVYEQRDARGELLMVIGREEGRIAGYFVGFIAPGLHYRTCLTLTEDIFWLRPEVRGQRAGFDMFRFVEKESRRRGVQRMFVGSKLHKDASFLFEKLGYREIERYFSAWLEE